MEEVRIILDQLSVDKREGNLDLMCDAPNWEIVIAIIS